MSNEKDSSGFWNKRAKKYGHTGWANPVIYAFDQRARLMAIEKVLDTCRLKSLDHALDFGTGSGDFANMLSRKFSKVTGFDISGEVIGLAKSKFNSPGIRFISSDKIDSIGLEEGSLDLVLSITVLGHILDDNFLKETLELFHKKLRRSGIVIALEYCKTKELGENGYQKFRTYPEWVAQFVNAGFILRKEYGFFNPATNKISTFTTYLNDFWIKLYLAFRGPRFIGSPDFLHNYLAKTAGKVLFQKSDFFWEGDQADNLKIMIYEKKS